jgi:predicted porin
MRVLLATAVCLSILVVASSLVEATPSTIIYIPSTDTYPKGTAHMDVDTVFTIGQAGNNTSVTSIGGTYGVTDRLEVGLDYVTDTTNPLIGNAKYKVWNDDRFAIAVGAWLLGDPGTTGANQFYGLASYSADAGRFAIGFGRGSRRTLGTGENQLWLSYDKALNDKWWVGADYVSGSSPMGSLNLGVGYTLADNVSMILGYDFYNAAGPTDTATVQLDVNF